MSALVKAATALIEEMSRDERDKVAAVLATYDVARLPMAGDILRLVSRQFWPGVEVTTEDVLAVIDDQLPGTPRKQVYNALGYLTRRRAVRRLRYGVYALRDTTVSAEAGASLNRPASSGKALTGDSK